MSLHVGMYVNYFSLVQGGAESYAADLSRGLEALGDRVTIVAGRSFFRKARPARPDAEVLYSPCLYELREAGRLAPGRLAWLASAASESFFNLFARRHVGRFDVVHCHGFDTARAALGRPARRGPVVLTLHGPPSGKPRVTRLLRSLDAVVSPSEWLRDLVRVQHGLEPLLVPTGIDLERFAPMPRAEARRRLSWEDRPTVLFVGRLVQEKDVPTLLRAFRIVAGARPDALLRVVGGGVLLPILKRQAAALGIAPRVVFHGGLQRAGLREVYAAADVAALPSLTENFPIVALEALACGAPLVVSDAADAIARRFPVATFRAGRADELSGLLLEGLDGRLAPVPRSMLEPYASRGTAEAYARLYRDLPAWRSA